jgi:hypothetical protein
MGIKIFKFFLLSIILSPNLIGQQTNPFPANVITPTSYNGKGGSNTNYYSGKASISIPIFTYGQSNLPSVNVDVNYSTIGTGLEQVASCVGLGWSLNTGGFVKRIVVGTPDEFSYTKNSLQVDAGFLNTPLISITPPVTNPMPSRATLDDIYNNKIDGEPDIFVFSIPGYSGKIVIDKNQSVIGTIPQSDLIIKFTRVSLKGRINKFSIQTEDGTVYEFSDEEVLTYKTNIDGVAYTFNYTSTWLLSKIYSVTNTDPNDAIFFTYETYYSNEIVGKQYFSAAPLDNMSEIGSVCIASGGACCPTSFPYNNEDIKIDGNMKRITNIGFRDGTSVKFYYNTNVRCDLAYDKALDNITVLNPLGKTIKKYKFDFTYVSSAGEVAFNSCTTLDLSKRLMLKSITESGNENTLLPPYKFEYESSINLPARNTIDVDEWGFWYKPGLSPAEGGAKAYVLNKMIYPTGSFTSYEYELNDISWTRTSSSPQAIKGLRIKRIISNEGSDPIPSNNSTTEYIYTYNLPSNVTSGQVDFLPIRTFYTYHDFTKLTSACTIMGSSFSHLRNTNSINHSPINPFPVGNTCGYSVVSEEIKSGAQSLGKNVYYFKNFSDYVTNPSISGVNMQFPFPSLSCNISWGLGLPQKIETYNNAGSLLKKTENSYDVQSSYINSIYVTALKVGLVYGPVNRSQSNVNGDVYQYASYTPLTGKTTLVNTTNTEFYYTPGSATPTSLTADVTNEYIAGKNLLRSSSGFDSKGYKYRTVYYYPFDYNFTSSSTTYPAIGLMNSMNIIAPVIVKETWITKNNINYLIGSAVQDYLILSNGLIKPSKNYALQNSEPIPENLVPPMSANSIFRDPNLYKEISSVDIYNTKGNPIQITADKYFTTSTIYGYGDVLPVATVSNAKINEVAYTSFESFEQGGVSGNWSLSNGQIVNEVCPTGSRCYLLTNATVSVNQSLGLLINKEYKLTLWATSSSFSVNGLTPSFIGSTINGWTYYEFNLPTNSSLPVITGSCKIDELRLYPKKSTMLTTTYEPGVGKTSECDINNQITYYQYDALNRLVLVRDRNKNIIKKICYNYAGQQGDCQTNLTPVWTATGNLRCQNNGSGNTGYQEKEEIDANQSSPTYNQTRWVTDTYNTIACPLPAPPCTITMNYGFSNVTSGFTNNGSTVSFYMVFLPTSSGMQPGNSYYVTTVNGSCRPSGTRTIYYSSSGRNWIITIYPSGAMYWYLSSGTSVNQYSTIGTSTLTYNL